MFQPQGGEQEVQTGVLQLRTDQGTRQGGPGLFGSLLGQHLQGGRGLPHRPLPQEQEQREQGVQTRYSPLYSATGQIIKLGRVEYLVTSINNNCIGAGAESKSKFWMNNKKIIVEDMPALDSTS